MLRVLLDVDGVLADFRSEAEWVISKHVHRERQSSAWDVFGDLTPTERETVFAEISAPGWCQALPVLPGAQDAVRAIQEMAAVYIVTSPWTSQTWMYERYNWLEENFDIPQDRVVATHAKYTVLGDVFVDDKPTHIQAWSRAHPGKVAVLWQPEAHVDLRALHDWNELIETVKELT